MIWIMILPNDLLSFQILNRDFKSLTYIDLLSQTIVIIIKFNYRQSFWFEQDNSRIYTARIVKEFMTDIHFSMLSCHGQSSDLNIMKNICNMLQGIIYNRSAILNIAKLKEEIHKDFLVLNTTKRRIIINLYDTFRAV